jgi:hypothetical protein
MAALLYRANTSGRLDPRSYQNAMKYMSSRGWRTDEPGRREMGAPESPLMLGRAVKTFEVTSDRSLADLCMEHGLPVAEIQDLLEASVDARPIVEL